MLLQYGSRVVPIFSRPKVVPRRVLIVAARQRKFLRTRINDKREKHFLSVPESLHCDTGDPYLYLRFDCGRRRGSVIIGGEDHKTGQEKETEDRYESLTRTLKQIFPAAKPSLVGTGS